MSSPCLALIVAGGTGERFGGPVPKQYRLLAGRPVLRHTAERLLSHPDIDGVRVVVHPAHAPWAAQALDGLPVGEPIAGGASRQGSVRNGLEALAGLARPPARVLIHDAARPLVDAATVDRVIAALADAPAAVPGLPVADTLRRADTASGRSAGTVDRTGLWRAQTPQGFRFADILAAHRALAARDFTDDAAVAEAAGLAVALVPGHDALLKITTEQDLDLAARLLAGPAIDPGAPDLRVGQGFDVHRFGPGDHVMLGGVAIPHDRGLLGHSDADVALHALTDAILGAAADGDIGQHFPPSDPRWRGAASDQFLRHAVARAAARGLRCRHVDLTVICERPKLGPHRTAIAERLSGLLELPVGRIGVKATTSESLGFTGRGEGIAALAVATLIGRG